ncbi:MAG TPA: hypothetical protein VIR78_15105 [Malonomonas sp.]
MLKLLRMLLWLILVLVVVGGLDQFLVRVPLDTPGLAPVQTFYVDFRSRLLGLVGVETVAAPPATIEQVIEATGSAPQQTKKSQRYLYVDEAGELQFADSLAQVPVKFRKAAQPLAE